MYLSKTSWWMFSMIACLLLVSQGCGGSDTETAENTPPPAAPSGDTAANMGEGGDEDLTPGMPGDTGELEDPGDLENTPDLEPGPGLDDSGATPTDPGTTGLPPADFGDDPDDSTTPGATPTGNTTGSAPPVAPPANAQVGFEIGNLAPEIMGEDIDGVKFKLSDYRGKVVVLDFWGDW